MYIQKAVKGYLNAGIFHSRKYIQIEICMHLIVARVGNFSRCKMQIIV